MAELGSPTPLAMGLSGTPGQGTVAPIAEGVQPFTPIDPMADASKAYALADKAQTFNDDQLKRQDRDVMTEYLKNGGNMSTPQGVQRAMQDLSGKLSPASQQDLMKMGANVANWDKSLNDYYAALPGQQVERLNSAGQYTIQALQGPLEAYKKASEAAAAGGSQNAKTEALQAFEVAKQAQIQMASQLKDPATGQPVFQPQEIEQFKKMTPEQMQSQMETAQWHMDRIKEASSLAKTQAETRKANVSADVMEQGGAAGVLYAQMVEKYGENSPQAQAVLSKMQGAAGKAAGVPEGQVNDEERRLAVAQWIQNPSSLRGLDKTYQQNVIKWASQYGITPEDVGNGQAARKFQLSAATASGTRAGQMASVEATMPKLIDNAMEASAKLPRTSFVPWNKVVQMGKAAFSDPDLREFAIAQQAVESEFQQVIARGGSNVASLQKAHDLVTTADSPETYAVAMNMLKKEIAANVGGAEDVKNKMGASVMGKLNKPSAAQERGYEEIRGQIKSLQQVMADSKPGSDTYNRAKASVEEAQAELDKHAGKTPAAPSAQTNDWETPDAKDKIGITVPKISSREDLKAAMQSGKLKPGDKFLAVKPDGTTEERVLNK